MSVEYKKTLEIKYNADVVVAGGGPAGVAAAGVAAAVCVEDNCCAKDADTEKIKTRLKTKSR